MPTDIQLVSPSTPIAQAIEIFNQNHLKNRGKALRGLFDRVELDQIFQEFAANRRWHRQIGLGNTLSTFPNWIHVKDNDGYAIWKIPVEDYSHHSENSLYWDEAQLENRGVTTSELISTFNRVFAFDGSQFEDVTAEAASEFGSPFGALNSTTSYLYIGDPTPFSGLDLSFETLGLNVQLVVEYSKGGGVWGTPQGLVDETVNASRSGRITFSLHNDFAQDTVNGESQYWVRIKTALNPLIIPKLYFVQPLSSVVNRLSLSADQILNRQWAWVFYNGFLYVTIPNSGSNSAEGFSFIKSSSSAQNKENFFVSNHEYIAEYESFGYTLLGTTSVSSIDYAPVLSIPNSLTLHIKRGRVELLSGFMYHADASIDLPANQASLFVFIDEDGVLSSSAIGFPTNCTPIAQAVTDATEITSLIDRRVFINTKRDPFYVTQIGELDKRIQRIYAEEIDAVIYKTGETIVFSDNIWIMNQDVVGTPTEDMGFILKRGNQTDAQILFREATDQFDLNFPLHIKPQADGSYVLGEAIANTRTVFNLGSTAGAGTLRLQNANLVLAPVNVYLSALPNENQYFNNGGNVGIGTASPSQKLSVVGNSGATQIQLEDILADSNPSFSIKNDAREWLLGVRGNNSDAFVIGDNTAGVNRLVIDAIGNVGIGIITPNVRLVVGGLNYDERIALDNNGIVRTELQTDGSGGYVGTYSNHDFRLKANNTVFLTVKNTGLVGVGTALPQADFHIQKDVNGLGATMILGNHSGNASSSTQIQFQNTTSVQSIIVGGRQGSGGSYFDFKTAPFGITPISRLYINQDGNIGIGITDPQTKLHIANTTHIRLHANSTEVGFEFWKNLTPTKATYIGMDRQGVNGLQDDLIFSLFDGNAWSEALRLKQGGNVGIGTTLPTAKLHLFSAAAESQTLRIETASDGSNAKAILSLIAGNAAPQTWNLSSSRATGLFLLDFSGTPVLAAGNNGNVGIGTITPGDMLVVQKDQNATTWVGISNAFPGSSASAGLYIAQRDTGNTGTFYTFIYKDSSKKTRIDHESLNLMTLLHTGNVGIGLTAPEFPLHVLGKDAVFGSTLCLEETLAPRLRFKSTTGNVRYHIQLDNASQQLQFLDDNRVTKIQFTQTGDIFTSGAVAIGTSFANSYWLRVNGNVNIGTPTSFLNYLLYTRADYGGAGGILAKFQNDHSASSHGIVLDLEHTNNLVADFGENAALIRGREAGVTNFFVTNRGGAYFAKGVGIGIQIPLQLLHIADPSSAQALIHTTGGTGPAVITLKDQAGRTLVLRSPENILNAQVGTSTGHRLELITQNLVRVSITEFGNVGIGSGDPTSLFHIGRGGQFRLGAAGNVSPRDFVFRITNGQTNVYDTLFIMAENGVGSETFVTRMAIHADGNVGIGRDDPSYVLSVRQTTSSSSNPVDVAQISARSTVQTAAGYGSRLLFESRAPNDNSYNVAAIAGLNPLDGSSNEGSLAFYTLKTGSLLERIRIDNNGTVGIGTSNPDPAYRMHVSSPGLFVNAQSGSNGLKVFRDNSHYHNINFDSTLQFSLWGDSAISLQQGGTERLRIDLLGNFGINTSSPQAKLQVVSNTPGKSAVFGRFSGASGLFLHSEASSAHYNWRITTQDVVDAGLEIGPSTTVGGTTWASPILIIKQDGRVGIGTIPGAGAILHVDNAGGALLRFSKSGSGRSDIEVDGTNMLIGPRDSGDLILKAGAFSEIARIKAGGFVGIGTPSPGARLHVVGNDISSPSWSGDDLTIIEGTNALLKLHGTNEGGVDFASPTDRTQGVFRYNFGGSYFYLNGGNLGLGMSSGISEKLTIDGRILLSSTTQNLSIKALRIGSLSESLKIEGETNNDAGSTAVIILNTKGGGGAIGFRPLVDIQNNGSVIARFNSDGAFGVGTGTTTSFAFKLQVGGSIGPHSDNAYNLGSGSLRFQNVFATNGTIQTSDGRLKDRITTCQLGLDFVDHLRPVAFFWKADHRQDNPLERRTQHFGLIAQDLAQILTARGINPKEFAPLVHDPASDHYGLRYTELIAILIKSIQELNQKIKNLEQEVFYGNAT